MKNIGKFALLIVSTFLVGTLFSETTGFNQIGGLGYYYKGFLSPKLDGTAVQNLLFNIFFVLAGFLFIVALIVAFVAAIRLLISDNGEEDFSKWLNTLIWSTLGLFLVGISYTFVNTISRSVFNNGNGNIALNTDTLYQATNAIIYPILNFLRYISAICFFIMIIYAFYKIIFAGGDEEGFQNGKKIFITATLGFIIMLLAEPIVRMAYGGDNCRGRELFGIPTDCTNRVFDTSLIFGNAIKVIIFLNGFIALVTVLMIIYAGILILTGGGDEEKSEKAKKIITYAIVGVVIIIFSYVLYRAMLFNVN